MCKFQKGQEYRTRGGGRARVYANDGWWRYPIHGAIYDQNVGWIIGSWTADGRCVHARESPEDIFLLPIADEDWPDWVPPGSWYSRGEDGVPCLSLSKPILAESGGWICGAHAFVRLDIWPYSKMEFPHPPEGMAWEETICQKPFSNTGGNEDGASNENCHQGAAGAAKDG